MEYEFSNLLYIARDSNISIIKGVPFFLVNQMILPRYEYSTESKAELFKFTSEGIKGNILKLIVYSQMLQEDIYNLAFGDYNNEKSFIDDTVVTNNNDSQKVLELLLQLCMFLPTMCGFTQRVAILQEHGFIGGELLRTWKRFK